MHWPASEERHVPFVAGEGGRSFELGPGLAKANFANRAHDSYRIGFPRGGRWEVLFNSDWSGYSPDLGNHPGYDTEAWPESRDGLGFQGHIGIGPYSALVLAQGS